MLRSPVLAAQSFAGSPLVRGAAGRRLDQILAGGGGSDDPAALFCLVADRRVAVTGRGPAGPASPAAEAAAAAAGPGVRWLDRAGLAASGLSYPGSGDELVIEGVQGSREGGSGEAGQHAAAAAAAAAPVYFLGEDRRRRALRLAVDVSAAPRSWAEQRGMRLQDLRSLMPVLPPEELAMAGHAMALSQWHQAHLFCGRCGAPSRSVDAGARRQCTRHEGHRQYPRTDPVVIMLVESPDGASALLGRSKAMRPGMLTCLSGFVDQGEGVEEAVRRETREESGIELAAVDIVGSQPWPVGRGGSCELMLGCVAKAASAELTVDPEEMDEVRWVSREEVAQAVEESRAPNSPYLLPPGSAQAATSALGFFVPPPWAIAHHLMQRWVQHGGPWFPATDGEEGEQQQHERQQATSSL